MINAFRILALCLLINSFFFSSCKSGNGSGDSAIATDSASITAGEKLFVQNCSSCHGFLQDGIGPQLGGVTEKNTVDWIKHFIQDPKTMISSGDKHAQDLFEKYHAVMPSFTSLSDDELNQIISFLSTHKLNTGDTAATAGFLTDPIPQPIELSDLLVDLQPIAQIPPSSTQMPRTRITKISFQPEGKDLFVVDLRGKLYRLVDNKPLVYLNMAKLEPDFIDQPGLGSGFGSFAFHPDFARNGLLYTTHTEPSKTAKADFSLPDSVPSAIQYVLTEWKTDHPEALTFSGKGRELLRIDMVSVIHGVQEITFNPLAKAGSADYGLLYIGIGDGGSVENGYPFIPHRLTALWGTIIRIDPGGKNSVNGRYGIPATNPFSKAPDPQTAHEIYAYGFRNPHRINWLRSGQMYAINIGHGNIESVNFIFPGSDYGWPLREGTFALKSFKHMNDVFPLPANDSNYHFTYPVIQYDHGEGKAIASALEYEGSDVPELTGKLLFGDISNGRLFYSVIADLKQGTQAPIKEFRVSLNGKPVSLPELCGTDRVELRLGRDQRGELYLLTKPDGKIYRFSSAKLASAK